MPRPMASDTLTHPSSRRWIDDAVFLAFLLLAFVGVAPFSPPPPEGLAGTAVVQTGAGDMLRQVCYLAVFAAIVLGAFRQRGLKAFSSFPLVLLALLVWCVASALWSPEPAVTLRRSGLAVVLVVSAMLSVQNVGAERSLAVWRWVLLAVLIVNIVSVKFIPAAMHLPGEADPQLVGNWRGLYGHKNIAGSVGAMTALIFLFTPFKTLKGKLFDLAVVGLAVFFTAMTHSKSSLGLLAVAMAMGGVYRLAWRREIDRVIAVVVGGLVMTAATVFLIADQSAIVRLFDNPQEFTGRTEIWRAELAYIRDHPLFGAGFGSFSDTGKLSPLYHYIGGWVTGVSHGHNGYLQLLVTIGGIGFALAFVSLIVLPAVEFWRRGDTALKALLFSLFVFLLLHNLMETDFLQGDGVTWVAYLLMIAMLGGARRTVS
jgi:exopolysaccharide production protein ExoQ